MKIACTLILALLAAAVDGYVNYGAGYSSNGNGYASSQYSAVRPYGNYASYNGVPSVARAQNYYPNLASSYYNPYATNNNNPYATNNYNPYATNNYNQYQTNQYNTYRTNTYNPYLTNTNSQYQTNPYTSTIYNQNSQFVGSTLANQFLSSTPSLITSGQQVGNVCPTTTSRTIIISDYIKYGVAQTYPCIGACVFQPNVVLDNVGSQNYDKNDVVVVMVGPYSYPRKASEVMANATLIAALAARTNLYLTTIPVRPTVTDAAVLEATANANALVRSAANANPSASLLDYQAFYNTYVSKNENQWAGLQMCNWLREQIPTPVATANTPAPAVAGTLAPF